MTDSHQPHADLDLEQNQRFSIGQYRVQRAGRIAFVIILLAAVVGFFGGGPIASVSRSSHDGSLTVAYDRFIRRDNANTLEITIAASQTSNGEARLGIDVAWLNAVTVTSIIPEPASQETRGEMLELVFSVADPAAPVAVTIAYSAENPGSIRATFALDSGQKVGVWQLVYP